MYTDFHHADFEWDFDKDVENQLKHGVSFETARIAFYDPKRIVLEDLNHSRVEKRLYCIGSVRDGILTVRFTLRKELVRIIGAGYWRKGKSIYEKENQIH
ncbi:MAG: BrnT family toxin [Elusimicrobiota bacterium]